MRSIFIKEIKFIFQFHSWLCGTAGISRGPAACSYGSFLNNSILGYGYASMDRFFEIAPWLLLLLVPAVTMRSLADEFRTGTIEWLSTKPLTDLEIIVGKYLATLAAYCICPPPYPCIRLYYR